MLVRLSGYHLYKWDTEVWVSWILNTAQGHGRIIQTLDVAQLEGSSKVCILSPVGYTSDPKAAEFLIESKCRQDERNTRRSRISLDTRDHSHVSPTVCRSFRRAVAARKRYAARYAGENLGPSDGTDGHVYFIWVLEESYRFLTPFLSVQSVAKFAQQRGSNTVNGGTATRYDALQCPSAVTDDSGVDSDVEVVDEDLPLPGSPCLRREQPLVYTSMINKKSDLYFKYVCLKEETEQVLSHVQTLRTQCEDGELHYVAFAYTVEAAVALIGAKETQLHTSAAAEETKLDLCIPLESPMRLAFGTLVDVKAAWANSKGRTCLVRPLDVRYASASSKALVERDRQLIQFMMELQRKKETRNTTQAFGYHQPLPRACEDQISKFLQPVNEGGPITLVATLSAAVLAQGFDRPHRGQREPQGHLIDISNAFNSRMSKLRERNISFPADLQKVVGAFHVAKAWLTEWPLPKAHADLIRESISAVQHGYIPPPQDGDFLRRASTITCGSLSIVLCVLWNEIGLSVLNSSPHVFAMCHLHNALKRMGRLSGSWKTIESLSDRFVKGLFMGEQPENIDVMHSRIQVAAGKSFAAVAALKRVRYGNQRRILTKPLPNTNKTWDLQSSNISIALREYVHGRQDLVRTLHDLDAELARTGGTQRMLSNNPDINGFLSVLADALEHELSFLRVDHMTLDAACRAMFRRIDESIGNEAVGEEDPDQSWEVTTTRSFEIVFQVLTEMKNVKQLPIGKGSTPLTDTAMQTIQDYINAGAIGIPY